MCGEIGGGGANFWMRHTAFELRVDGGVVFVMNKTVARSNCSHNYTINAKHRHAWIHPSHAATNYILWGRRAW